MWLEHVQFVSDTLKDKEDKVTGGEFKSPNLHPSVNTELSAREKKASRGDWIDTTPTKTFK